MAQLIVRDIENDLKERLQKRAARHGHSMEAEVRDILRNAVGRDQHSRRGLGTEIAELFAEIGLRPGEEIPELHGPKLRNPFKP